MPPWWFTVPALVISALFGVLAVPIFGVSLPKDKTRPARLAYQFWFNLIGSLAGWSALWALSPRQWFDGKPVAVTWGSAAVAIVAFAGITGHLPFVFMEAVASVKAVMAALAKAVERWLTP